MNVVEPIVWSTSRRQIYDNCSHGKVLLAICCETEHTQCTCFARLRVRWFVVALNATEQIELLWAICCVQERQNIEQNKEAYRTEKGCTCAVLCETLVTFCRAPDKQDIGPFSDDSGVKRMIIGSGTRSDNKATGRKKK